MRKIIIALVALSFSFSSSAQDPTSPIGKWKTLDDKTGKAMTITEVFRAPDGTLSAKIVENLGMSATCTECSGANKNKPFVGMLTLWNMKAERVGAWGGGNGYKPSEDTHFTAKSMTLSDGGNKLDVKGCKSIFCRTATWVRVK